MRMERRVGQAGDSRPHDEGRLLQNVLRCASDYFNMKTYGFFLARRVFCNRILNFIYEASREGKIYGSAYLFCVKNCAVVWTNPKLYMYPLRVAFLS